MKKQVHEISILIKTKMKLQIFFVIFSFLNFNVCAFTPSKVSKFNFLFQLGSKGSLTPPPPPPPPSHNHFSSFGDFDGEGDQDPFINLSILGTHLFLNNDEICHDDDMKDIATNCETNFIETLITTRGGGNSEASSQKVNTQEIIAGSKSTLQSAVDYWSDALQTLKNKLDSLNPFSKQDKDTSTTPDEIDLSTLPVQNVLAPQSTILPEKVVRAAGQRSGLVGSVMRADRVQECAKHIKMWYSQRGYVLHSVTGATLHADNGTATLVVQEPLSASLPVGVKFAKEVPIDPETGEHTTLRKYRAKLEKIKGREIKNEDWVQIQNSLNRTLVETNGRTNPRTLSKRLDMRAGKHFRWNGDLWQNIMDSGIFSRVFKAGPVLMSDGTVQVQILAQEPPPRNLEYGVQKSLYTGNWEGELDFKHENLLGGGENLGFVLRRGAKDPEPSYKILFTDDKFGMARGYETELFSEYIAIDHSDGFQILGKKEGAKPKPSTLDEADTQVDDKPKSPIITDNATYDDDDVLSRKGLRLSLRNPISTKIMNQSSASTSLERTSTRTGRHESIASGTMSFGPFVRRLPGDAKTSLTTSITTGTRIGGENDSSWRLFPYSSVKSTARQLFPLFTETLASRNRDDVNLALLTTVTSSTRHLPRHEANAAGFSAGVRGYPSSSNGPICASAVGSVEIRIPVTIPFQKERFNQDGKVVLFGDWMIALQKKEKDGGFGDTILDWRNKNMKKSSVGIGLRKSIQGIPLKYDLSLTKEGKIGAFLGLGHDWAL